MLLLSRVCCVRRLWIGQDRPVRLSSRRHPLASRSAFAGLRVPAEVITVSVRWYLRLRTVLRDVEELLAECGAQVDHVTVFRWVQRFAPLFADASRFARHSPGERWFVEKTFVKSTASGAMSTGPSTNTSRSSTCSSHRVGPRRGPPLLRPCADDVEGDLDRGGDRSRAGLSPSPGRAGPLGLASRETYANNRDRLRPRPAQTPAAAHARLRSVVTAGSACKARTRRMVRWFRRGRRGLPPAGAGRCRVRSAM